MTAGPRRVIALGASNLTRGFATLAASLRASAGPGAEIFAALGLGRSYGMRSRVLVRTLPPILDCGLWAALSAAPPAPSRALVTDVGNDILYGAEPARILDWVAEAVERLRQATPDLVVTGLPLASLRGLSRARFLAFRTVLYPPARIGLAEAIRDAEEVERGLERIAVRAGARFVPLRAEWYGLDPVHIRPARWNEGWREILGATQDAPPPSLLASARVLSLPPERQWILGFERRRTQTGTALRGGGRAWLF